MLYNLLYPLADGGGFLNLFKYITFRTVGATLTALTLSFILGPYLIRWLKQKQKHGQPIRTDGPESHLITKVGTPTMGGILILLTWLTSTLLWADLGNTNVWVIIWVAIGFGLIGMVDDIRKVKRQCSGGIRSRHKFLAQIAIALVAAIAIQYTSPDPLTNQLAIPFLKSTMVNFGILYIPFIILVMVGASNAVNLTDGLDGLAIVPIMIAAGCFLLISYLVGNAVFSQYLQINHVIGSGELAVICGALVGSALGFLWYNAPPAMIFMGDTGSLAAGGILGAISAITKHELILVIIGGLFVLETVSVIVQVASFKLTGKRVFKMAPLHHHFEKKGWAEPTIVIRFWIIAGILAMIGLSSLKIR